MVEVQSTEHDSARTQRSPDADVLAAEVEVLRRKLAKSRRLALILALPWLILLAPITVPAAVVHFVRRRLKVQKSLVNIHALHKGGDPARAMALLRRHAQSLPPGTLDLFGTIDCADDAEWLDHMNSWARVNKVPEVALAPGPEPRFVRIKSAGGLVAGIAAHRQPLISVIMAAHNAQDTLEAAAASILGQTWSNLELVIVDDASTDSTRAIAKSLAARDRRLRLFFNDSNAGPYAGKNLVLPHLRGQYVTCHDADDFALPNRLEVQMAPLLDSSRVKASIGTYVRLDRNGGFAAPGRVNRLSPDGIRRRAMVSLLISMDVMRDTLGFWDSVRFGADSELLSRVADLLGPDLAVLPDVVMFALHSAGSLTTDNRYGIETAQGLSPIRQQYKAAFLGWHGQTAPEHRRIGFPHTPRKFPAPKPMLVPEEVVAALLATRETEVSRQGSAILAMENEA